MAHALPDPQAKDQLFTIAYDRKAYGVTFWGGKAREVQVRTQSTRARMATWRMLWHSYSVSNAELKGRAAELIGFVLDPAKAEKAGAIVEGPPERAARFERERAVQEAKRQQAIAEDMARHRAHIERERLADAAPAMLKALKRLVAAEEGEDSRDLSGAITEAMFAIKLAEGSAAELVHALHPKEAP